MAGDRSRSSLFALFSIVVVDLIGFGIVIPVLPFYAEAYGASATVLGMLLTSYAIMQFAFAPLWGRLSDRIGRRPVLLVTIAGTALSLLLLGLAQSLAWLFAARILGGIFGANISVATAYVSDVTSEEERTRWMGMIGASFGIGFILGPAIGGALSPYGYGLPMLVAAGMAAANWIQAALRLPEPLRHQRDPAGSLGRLGVLQNPLVRRLCAANFTFAFAMTQLETVFAFFMLHRFRYDAREVAAILVMMALIMAVIQGGAIRGLAARFGEKSLLVGGAVMLGLSFAAVPWMNSVPLLLVPLAVSALGRAISQPSLLSMVSVAASPATRGVVLGAFQSGASLARVVGPLAAGALYDVSQGAPFGLASLLMVGVVSLGLSLPGRAERGLAALDTAAE